MLRLQLPAGALVCVLATAFLLTFSGTASAAAKPKNCGNLTLGTAVFTKIRATGVSCATAKRLIDRATLAKNRGGNVFWVYKGWEWSVQGVDEMTNKLRGKRGKQRISATWSAT